ncbi:MAG: topoisomerase IV [Ruminococcaceae bacterium]|nr:topoisomerase IV [Oscillospiraceae bacterium]
MAEKKSPKRKGKKVAEEILPPAPALDQAITDTLRVNYMPYAMSVIISRAIPDIDGFKPSQRKLLYTMYDMGLMHGPRTKSANVAGATMHLHPHGDASIYETLVRLTTGNESLLHPFIDSKGTFGKRYSTMAYAAARYTECRLDPFCETIFGGIDKDAVDFVDNYDGTMKEPTLLPTAFPNILVSANLGIAVGMATNICSFNLGEICDATCELMKNPDADLIDIIKAPDFSTGGLLLYDREQMKGIYETGKGSFRVRARYSYDKKENCIEVTQIPYTTTVEAVIAKIAKSMKEGKFKEISDVRDEIDLNGMKLTIDLKRGADPEKLMQKLFRSTPLEDTFPCNFNVLICGSPKTLGVRDILNEWIAWRTDCVKRELYYNLCRMEEKLHLLYGLRELLCDIDKAIKIIRETESEKQVVPNLMAGFNIDEIQAEYIAEIKLRNLNREHILKRIAETEKLEQDIADTKDKLSSSRKIHSIIAKQLQEIKKKYAKPRKTQLIYTEDEPEIIEPEKEAYPVIVVMSKEGYFKKLIPYKGNLPQNNEQKLKDGDSIVLKEETTSECEILFFTDKCQCYKAKADDFETHKASMLGEYVPAKLGFDDGENVVATLLAKDYKGSVAFFFKNGKAVSVPLNSYATKLNRKKLTNAYSDDSPAVGIFFVPEKEGKKPVCEFLLRSTQGKAIIMNSDQLAAKATRTASGVYVFTLKKGISVENVSVFCDDGSEEMKKYAKYRKSKLPSTGTLLEAFDINAQQVKLF